MLVILAQGGLDCAMHEVDPIRRGAIAATWLNYYNR